MYSELNVLWEGWLDVFTADAEEAIESRAQKKGLDEYRRLMTRCFREIFRILKPGRWVTIEFSNTQASVWNSIQTALQEAGLVVANVSALNKKQGSFNAVTNPTSVKQDLVISGLQTEWGIAQTLYLTRPHCGIRTGISSKRISDSSQSPKRNPQFSSTLSSEIHAYYSIGWWLGLCVTTRQCHFQPRNFRAAYVKSSLNEI